MGRKKKTVEDISSSDSSSEELSESQFSSSFSQQASSDSSQSQPVQHKKLTKKDLKKLIKLQKAIKEEKRLLRRIKEQKKTSKTCQKKQPKKQDRSCKKQEITNTVEEEESPYKKLFITGIQDKYTHEEVKHQLKQALSNIKGVVGFRVKRKEGNPTYAFLDFQSKEKAKQGLQKIRKVNIFGLRRAVYYSHQQKQKEVFRQEQSQKAKKKCFGCNQYGHYAKDCFYNKAKEYKQQQKVFSAQQTNQIMQKVPKKEIVTSQPAALDQQQHKESKRVVRDKSRLNRLLKN